MTTYYTDTTVTFASAATNNGTSSSTPWGGIGGIQRSLFAIVAGDVVKIKAGTELDSSKLLRMTKGGSAAGSLTVGTRVYEFTTTNVKGDAEGYICGSNATYLWIESTVGTWASNGRISKESSVPTNYQDYTSFSTPGLTTQVAGSSTLENQVIGVNATWTDDGTQVEIDGNLSASSGIRSAHNYYLWKNLYLKNMSSEGVWSDLVSHNNLYNVKIEGCVNGTSRCTYSALEKVAVSGHSQYGIRLYSSCNLFFSSIRDGTGATYPALALTGDGNTIFGCLIEGNAGEGLSIASYGNSIVHLVIDGNGRHGINLVSARSTLIYASRITYNGGGSASYYGIYNKDVGAHEDYNVFYSNGDGANHVQYASISLGNSLVAGSDAEVGYTDRAGGDFNLSSGAIMRSQPVVIP